MIENITETYIDKEEEKRIFSEMAKIDGIADYFRDTINLDIMRYFQCSPDQQPLVKGAHMRTFHFLQKLKKAMEENIKVDEK